MRSGYTTGSCATAAAKAAAYMLLGGRNLEKVSIITPSGIKYEPLIEKIDRGIDYVSCAVKKDSGDDPDITNGMYIHAKVCLGSALPYQGMKSVCNEEFLQPGLNRNIVISGGAGIGKVTRLGLEMPVGEYAINKVPRRMIAEAVSEVCELFDYESQIAVEIYAPEGEDIAKKTFNPHMGIEGGISILGTTGIVEPMSSEALIKTIELDLRQKKAEGEEWAILVPGNYGATFLKNNYAVDEKRIVQFSNYVGIAIDKAKEVGFKKVIMVGHTGKLVKVSGGIMNTHSKEADSRMELMVAATILTARDKGITVSDEILNLILDQVSTTGALEILKEHGLLESVSEKLLERIVVQLKRRAGDDMEVEVILYENSFGLLAKTPRAEEVL